MASGGLGIITGDKAEKMMTEEHKQLLTDHRPALIGSIRLGDVLNYLESYGVIVPSDVQKIKSTPGGEYKNNETFLDILRGTSELGFEVFIKALKKSSQHALANLLKAPSHEGQKDGEASDGNISTGENKRNAPSTSSNQQASKKIKGIPSGPEPLSSAPMVVSQGSSLPPPGVVTLDGPGADNGKGKRLLVIFNNFTEERTGTKKDEENIKRFFTTLKFSSLGPYHNSSKKQFIDRLEEVKEELNKNDYDQLVVFVLSHGNKEGIITCLDDGVNKETDAGKVVVMPVDDLVNSFKGEKVNKLIGRPKLFFIQACRGSAKQPGGDRDDDEPVEEKEQEEDDDGSLTTTPNDADILISYSTTPDYVSKRNISKGTWFVQDILEVFEANYQKMHVLDMMTSVNAKMAARSHEDKKQMSCQFSTLTKPVMLKKCKE